MDEHTKYLICPLVVGLVIVYAKHALRKYTGRVSLNKIGAAVRTCLTAIACLAMLIVIVGVSWVAISFLRNDALPFGWAVLCWLWHHSLWILGGFVVLGITGVAVDSTGSCGDSYIGMLLPQLNGGSFDPLTGSSHPIRYRPCPDVLDRNGAILPAYGDRPCIEIDPCMDCYRPSCC